MVDAREGLSAQDYEIANYLRRLGKPTVLVGNKNDKLLDQARLGLIGGVHVSLYVCVAIALAGCWIARDLPPFVLKKMPQPSQPE